MGGLPSRVGLCVCVCARGPACRGWYGGVCVCGRVLFGARLCLSSSTRKASYHKHVFEFLIIIHDLVFLYILLAICGF